jgi:hypothetical protein
MTPIPVRTASRLWFRMDAATRTVTRVYRRWAAHLLPVLSL